MLVLRRKVGECVVIPGVGRIMLCSAGEHGASIGFEIDRKFAIQREELLSFHPAPRDAVELPEAAMG